MFVPLIDLKAQYESLKDDLNAAAHRVLASGHYVMDDEVEAFEAEWAAYCKAKHCIAVSSATDALYLAILGVTGSMGERIITTPFTFFATTQAIYHSGNVPEYMDVDESGNIPYTNFGDRIALPVNMYGRPGNWKGDYIIEDSAQAHGVPLRGLAACYSFYPTKNLGAIGQAGAVVTNNDDLARIVRKLRTYGEGERFVHHSLTGNYRMDELQAAFLRVKLKHLDEWNDARRIIAHLYNQELSSLPNLRVPEDEPGHVYHIYALRVHKRASLQKYLLKEGIQTAVRYPVPMHLQPSVQALGKYRQGDFRMAEAWCDENLSLPMYPEMKQFSIEYVISRVRKWATGSTRKPQRRNR